MILIKERKYNNYWEVPPLTKDEFIKAKENQKDYENKYEYDEFMIWCLYRHFNIDEYEKYKFDYERCALKGKENKWGFSGYGGVI